MRYMVLDLLSLQTLLLSKEELVTLTLIVMMDIPILLIKETMVDMEHLR